MASTDQSLIYDPRWAIRIKSIVVDQIKFDIGSIPPACIFQVPKTITTTKPEAYEPQQIGFGPNHHFRPGPYAKMEQDKVRFVHSFLLQHQDIDFLKIVQKLVPVMRYCYNMFLNDDNSSLAWIFLIDGLFLLDVLQAYESKQSSMFLNDDNRFLSQDIMMLENQIPYMLLNEMDEAIHSSTAGTSSEIHANNFLLSRFRSFCEIHSPLDLCTPSQAPTDVEHLLHYMYCSIINKYGETMSGAAIPTSLPISISHFTDFFKKIPHQQIAQLYEQVITALKQFSTRKITIPSACELQGRAGFKFCVMSTDQGIKNIYIWGNEFFLPCVTLKEDSEVILRNLVAYEELNPMSRHFPFTEYMDLMCGLIVNVDDVKLLKKEKIIKSDLGEQEVVKIFVGISTSLKRKEKFFLKWVIREANEVYESKPMIKAYLLLKKPTSWLLVGLTAIGSFVGATWKIVAFMVSIVSVFLLTYQAYCEVYGCDKTVVTLPYAPVSSLPS